MRRRRIVVLLAGCLLAGPLEATATAPELPSVVLYAPRGQAQKAGELSITCFSEGSGFVADSFDVGWPPVRVRRGAQMLVRLETAKEPSKIEIIGPRGPLAFTFEPHTPEGTIVAWDARFSAPGRAPRRAIQERNGRRYQLIIVRASWADDTDCTNGKQGDWGLSLQSRP